MRTLCLSRRFSDGLE